jgi:uroporphyrinogen decarboxylase
VRTEADVDKLFAPDPHTHLRYVTDAVTQIRSALNGSIPLIGFSGSPYTLACYMVEGGASTDFRHIKTMLYTRPDLLHHLLTTTAHAVTAYLNAQIEAGAQVIMLFDTWGGSLSEAAYREFSLAYMERILDGVHKERDGARVPRIVFTKGGSNWLEAIALIGADAVGLDWTVDIASARRRIGHQVALQGNADPAVLFGTPEAIRTEVERVLDGFGKGPGHVFNLGHGISQHTSPHNLAVLVDAVHDLSGAYH